MTKALGKPSRAQLEIALLVGGTMLMLWMYRRYLQRSLEIQQSAADALAAEQAREQAAANGHRPLAGAELENLRAMAAAWGAMTGAPPPTAAGEGA